MSSYIPANQSKLLEHQGYTLPLIRSMGVPDEAQVFLATQYERLFDDYERSIHEQVVEHQIAGGKVYKGKDGKEYFVYLVVWPVGSINSETQEIHPASVTYPAYYTAGVSPISYEEGEKHLPVVLVKPEGYPKSNKKLVRLLADQFLDIIDLEREPKQAEDVLPKDVVSAKAAGMNALKLTKAAQDYEAELGRPSDSGDTKATDVMKTSRKKKNNE